MTTKQIDYILELSQTLNFNRAAENLFISQSTLTYHIQDVEKEIGFLIFNRSGKRVSMTPAGTQFCITLRSIKDQLHAAIEQGQNFSSRYDEDIRICLMMRSALYFLPEIIKEYSTRQPSILISPAFIYYGGVDHFLKGEYDIYFGFGNELKKVSEVKEHFLFDSHIYLITKKDDPLAQKELVKMEDLKNRTLMVGGGSPAALRNVQQRIINSVDIQYFNSHDHETTLTNVASDRGISLAPGFLNDHTGEFAWTPFDCPETIPCCLYTHSGDQRESIKELMKLIMDVYKKHEGFPL